MNSGVYLSAINHYLPKLANLSLAGNNLRLWKDLEYMSGRKGKLEFLRELILAGNPIRELEYQNNRVEKYKRYDQCAVYDFKFYSIITSEVARRFPSLEMLDQEPIVKISFDVPHATISGPSAASHRPNATTFPVEMMPPFVTGVDGTFVSNFLMRYDIICIAGTAGNAHTLLAHAPQVLPIIRHPTRCIDRRISSFRHLFLLCEHLNTCAGTDRRFPSFQRYAESAQIGMGPMAYQRFTESVQIGRWRR